jgi:hypothetical protein
MVWLILYIFGEVEFQVRIIFPKLCLLPASVHVIELSQHRNYKEKKHYLIFLVKKYATIYLLFEALAKNYSIAYRG